MEFESLQLPAAELRSIELPLREEDLRELRERAAADGLTPSDEATLGRYLVYLGAAYLEAEQLVAEAESTVAAYRDLHRLYGAVGGRAAVLRFHYSDAARRHADEARAAAAHDRIAGAYEFLVEKLREEIAIRERRIDNLRRALER